MLNSRFTFRIFSTINLPDSVLIVLNKRLNRLFLFLTFFFSLCFCTCVVFVRYSAL